MIPAHPTSALQFVRTLENCPYLRTCPYREICRFVEQPRGLALALSCAGQASAHAGQSLLGAFCLLAGLAMCTTLLLIPVGVPLAALGTALLVSGR